MYNLTVHAIDLAKEFQQFPRCKDVHLYIVRNQLPFLVPAQRRVKRGVFNYIIINNLFFHINTQEKVVNIMPNILLVIPEEN